MYIYIAKDEIIFFPCNFIDASLRIDKTGCVKGEVMPVCSQLLGSQVAMQASLLVVLCFLVATGLATKLKLDNRQESYARILLIISFSSVLPTLFNIFRPEWPKNSAAELKTWAPLIPFHQNMTKC